MKNTLAHIISYWPFVGILLLVAGLPFPYGAFQRWTSYSLLLAYPLDYFVNGRWRAWRWTHDKWVYVAFLAMYALVPLWQLFDPLRTHLFDFTLEHYSPFLIVAVCGLCGMTDKIRLDWIAWLMLAVSAGIVFYVVGKVGFFLDEQYSWIPAFNWWRNEAVNTHMVINLYMNIAFVLGCLVLLSEHHGKWAKIGTAVLMLPSVFALLITEGRTGQFTWMLLLFILLLYVLVTRRRWWTLAVLGLFVVGSVGMLAGNERVREMFSKPNPRIYMWQEAWHVIAEHPIKGHGVCTARNEFVQRVLQNETLQEIYVQREVDTNPRYNKDGVVDYTIMHPHNAYLESWMQFGLLGLVVLLMSVVLPCCLRLGPNQIYLTLIVLAFAIQACFECIGTHLQALCLCLPVLFFHYARSESKGC